MNEMEHVVEKFYTCVEDITCDALWVFSFPVLVLVYMTTKMASGANSSLHSSVFLVMVSGQIETAYVRFVCL